ncbi:MAG: 5-formyltetrahydrofolate cyclo-ligase [Candidatus Hermodarchaeota archaeon]
MITLLTKDELRRYVWKRMTEKQVAIFPLPIYGRIPNFKGAAEAAKRVFGTDIWQNSKYIKSNPDSPQKWIRQKALEEGKTVFMAVPRLREVKCFVKLKVPTELSKKAATIRGAFKYGVLVHPRNMPRIDLVIAGSVAVNLECQRIGKGGGYSDLEYAIARHFNLITEDTPIVTTVHDLQVFNQEFELSPFDITLDMIMTPTRTLNRGGTLQRPPGILWKYLDKKKIENIPILKELQGLKEGT